MRRSNLKPGKIEEPAWDPSSAGASLASVVSHAASEAQKAIEWYQHAKRWKSRLARWFRSGAILGTALAGLIPLGAQIVEDYGVKIAPVWASVPLGIAALLVGFDRFFGCSAAWMRFIATEFQIHQLLHEFQLDWEAERAGWQGAQPSAERVQIVLARCKTFVTRLDSIVQQETNLWIAQFQETLKAIDETVKAKLTAEQPGGATVSVSNGEQCGDGWTLSIDRGESQRFKGKTAALAGLSPGLHSIAVEGKVQGVSKHAETVVSVKSGEIGSVTVELV